MLPRRLVYALSRPVYSPLITPTPLVAVNMPKRKHASAATSQAVEPPPPPPPPAAPDPEADGMDDVNDEADPKEIAEALGRPPPVNSDYLPLPWKGRLGYACLCTYLRNSNPPVFQSRTTRIASILEHRHPLKDPSQPEHATKNRPDKDKPANIRLGQEFVERLCLANCRDMIKMLRWNAKFNIKFLRLSSEAFPFASHAEYGYKLAPFASEALAEVGRVVAELGHRVSTHPGQFTQLGSPRKQVIDASIRDLEYHDEMLSLLKLPDQQDRDAIMVLHMGGTFGDKEATLARFRENYANLPAGVKKRLVLENDDVSWHVHDLLPVCEELNIPLVLDFHHHNIIFDSTKLREGTHDIMALFPAIRATWVRKGITQKMHYSEPTPAAITPRQRRKHNPRVTTLPPCPPDMDLMIEAKDKEQAVFELMRNFKLPGYDRIGDVLPHIRRDDNKPIRVTKAKAAAKNKAALSAEDGADPVAIEDVAAAAVVPEEEIGMGGPEGRVYWPLGMEDWLRPEKRVVKKKDPVPTTNGTATPMKPDVEEGENASDALGSVKKVKAAKTAPQNGAKGRAKKGQIDEAIDTVQYLVNGAAATPKSTPKTKAATKQTTKRASRSAASNKAKAKLESKPMLSDDDEAEEEMTEEDSADDSDPPAKAKRGASSTRRSSGRAKRARVSYKEEDDDDEDDD